MIAAAVARWRALSDGDQVQAHGLLLCGALFLVHFAFYSWWFIEDAAITFAFARNAAVGEGFVAYAGGEPVEGFSNPSWTLLLVFLRLLGVSPWIGAKLSGAVLGLATVGLGWAWARRVMGADAGRWLLLVPLLLATSPQHVLWCASGLENPLFGFLIASGALLLVREIEDGAPPWSAVPWFGLAITRPEAPMYVAVAGGLGFVLIAGRRGPGAAFGWALRWGAALGVPFVAWHGVRIGYFAWEFPNTYYAKLAEEDRFQPLKWDTRGWEYLRKWALWTTQGFLFPVYLLGQTGRGQGRGVAGGILVAIALLLLVPGLEWPGALSAAWKAFDEPEWFVAVRVAGFATIVLLAPGIGLDRPGASGRVLAWLLLATGLFFALYSGGDWMAGFRWINPVVVPLAVLFADGLRGIVDGLASRPRLARGVGALFAATPVVAGVILAGTHVGGPETSPYDVRRRVSYMHDVAARLDVDAPTQMEVDMGAQLWWFRGGLIDMAGLVDVPMAHHHWEKPFVAQYVYEERRPEFAHVHAYWGKKTHMTEHRSWRRDYIAIPDTPLSPRRTHGGNHVRRDLVMVDRWRGGAERRVEFDARLVLEGLDTPVPAVGVGETLYVSVGWRRTGAGSPFRAWLFAAGDGGTAVWELPPGYDWTKPVVWKPSEVITGRHRLAVPDSLPPGRYDLGLVVVTEGEGAVALTPTKVPEGARTDQPRYAVGEVRWQGALTVLTADEVARAVDDEIAVALAGAERGDCTAAAEAWERLRKRRAVGDAEVEAARGELSGPIARCYAAWAEAVDPIDAVDALVTARRWSHRDPVVRGAAGRVADALEGEGDRAYAAGDAAGAYAAWRDALAVDPSRTWLRRRAETARDASLGLSDPGSSGAPRRVRLDREREGPLIRRALVLWAVLLAVVALAAPSDPRGWSEGTPAVNAARVLTGLTDETAIDLPSSIRPLLGEKTLLVYFSPSCPHCQRAQPELNALAGRVGDRMKVVGVASGAASPGALAAYRIEYAVPYEMIADTDRSIAAAMGVRGTPSALLVRKKGEKTFVVDGWYPYQPGQDALIEMRVSPNPWEAFHPGEYQGNAVCTPCHLQESESWLLTHHSVAWGTLVKQGRDTDPECTGCHVVGAGQPTGWAGDGHSPLVDVGCEACHGPGGPHDGARVDPKTTCEGCHDAKHSIAFSVDKGLPLIDHYKANTLDDTAWAAVRRTLLDGSAPRELLAFPDGKHTGAASCASCHPTEHASWAASPHAHAMATLSADRTKAYKADAATSAECVSCHATANASGPPPATLDGYLVAESVGCESCHGPGEAHVAAGGGKGNIQALGEDCPVCVLEAICTRCHTEKWDPTWNLERKLPLVKHGAGGEAP